MNWRAPLRISLAAALVAAAVAGWSVATRRAEPRPQIPAPRAQAPGVCFRPAADGVHTAWLIAGPFDKPIPEPANTGEAQEGDLLTGKPWRLLACPEGPVMLGPQPSGVYYLTGSLVSETGGQRCMTVVSAGPTRVWLNGALVGSTKLVPRHGVHSGEFAPELRAGTNRLLLEAGANVRGSGFLLSLRMPPKGDGALQVESAPAPEVLALGLKDSGRARLAGLLVNALSLKPGDLWLSGRKPLDLVLSRTGSAPVFDGAVDLVLTAAPIGGGETSKTEQPLPVAELLAGPAKISVLPPEGDYLALFCSAAERGRSAREPPAPCCQLYSRERIEDEAKRIYADALLAAPGVGPDALALPRLKAEKALLYLSGYLPGEPEARAALEEILAGRQALAAAQRGLDPLDGSIGWIERAYWSAVDGSAQPYRLYLPRRLADPAERQGSSFPLVVYLHGWVPTYDKHAWVDEMPEFDAVMDKLNAILLVPFGRSNTDFVSIGEIDVLQAIEETCRRYPVDRDRISLCGYSMGGYGAYAIAAHFPDRFSALAALSGRPVPYFVERQGRTNQPRYKGYCLDVDTPLGLAGNLRYIPTRIWHGREDFVPFPAAQAMCERLKALGAEVELKEVQGDHWSSFDLLTSAENIGWLLARKRPARPAAVTLRTFSPRFGRAHWAEVVAIDKWTEPAELAVADAGRGRVTVKAANVREFLLHDVPAAQDVKVSGAEGFDLDVISARPGCCDVRGRLKRAPREGRWTKNAALSGPMKEACNTPFVVAFGTAGSGADSAGNEKKARRFAAEWQCFAKGLPQVLDEKTLSDDELKTRSIILFGSPATSRLVSRAREEQALECKLSDTEFEVGGRKASLAGERGLVLTRPNPWAPGKDRYLVICMGLFYGEGAAENHKLDLIPDFIVFGPGREGEGEPPAALAGYFDSDWKADPALVEVFELK